MADVTPSAEKDVVLTPDEVSALVGDDITFWLNSPFMTPDMLVAKVCRWVTRTRVLPPASDQGADDE